MRGGGAAHVGGRRGEHQLAGMPPGGFADGVNLIQRSLDRRRSGDVARNPDGEEQRVEAALLHPRNIDVAVLVPRREVERFFEHEPLRGVVVRVDDDGAIVQLAGAGRDFVARLRLRQNDHRQDRKPADEGGMQMYHWHGRDLTAVCLLALVPTTPPIETASRPRRRTARRRPATRPPARRLRLCRCRATSSRRARPRPSAPAPPAWPAAARRER